jgi:hypothetical protein
MSREKYILASITVLFFTFRTLPIALAQDGLQLNVPYLCPDGSTYVVHSCSSNPKGGVLLLSA